MANIFNPFTGKLQRGGTQGAQGDQGPQGDQGDQGFQGIAGGSLNWQGPWVISTSYSVDDGVENDGSSYLCISAHTSSATDEPGVGVNTDTYWELFAAKGNQGDQGNQGTQGVQGDQGDQGTQGTQGFQGTQGVQGDQGDQGFQGTQGDQGDVGATGSQGTQGMQGATGSQGPQGVKGDQGDTGATGAQGPQGVQGAKGDQGDTGATGSTGPQGDQGDQGVQGAKGVDWQGAWDSGTSYAVDDIVEHNGSSYICILASTNNEPPNGTYWELVASKGDQGFQGDQGVQGATGSGGGGGATIDVNQTSHGFSIGDAVYRGSSNWAKAQSNTVTTLATHVVSAVADVDNFTAISTGELALTSHGLGSAGDYLYVSNSTAGLLTNTQPSNYSNPMGFVVDANTIYIISWRAESDGAISRSVAFASFESDEAVTTGNGTIGFVVPEALDGLNLTDVTASTYTQGVTGTTDVQIRRSRAGTDADMLTTKVTIGAEYSASDGVINTSNDDVQEGDLLFVDVDAVHSGTAPNGLSVVLTFS